jgi:hypothetical protein
VRDNLGQVIQCVSHVHTRLRYVLKSMETFGSPTKVATVEVSVSQNEYVTSVSTDLNALNGVLITKDSVSGVDLQSMTEKLSDANVG